jgi:hypothetical protein
VKHRSDSTWVICVSATSPRFLTPEEQRRWWLYVFRHMCFISLLCACARAMHVTGTRLSDRFFTAVNLSIYACTRSHACTCQEEKTYTVVIFAYSVSYLNFFVAEPLNLGLHSRNCALFAYERKIQIRVTCRYTVKIPSLSLTLESTH